MTWLALLLMASSARAATLFIDLNNSPKEIAACQDAIGAKNVFVVTKSPAAGKVTRNRVTAMVEAMEAQNIPITKIIISGHQGSGHAMGSNGDYYSHDLKTLLERHPKTKASAVSLGFVACYATNVYSSQKFFLKPNKNIKQSVGFPIQSSTNENPDTAKMVGEYCQKGEEWAEKSTKQELCDIYPSFAKLLPNQITAICSQEAVASTAYGKDMCYDYEDLRDRCQEFDPDDKNLEAYERLLSSEDSCSNPPVDKNSIYGPGGSSLRKFYSQVHLWRQCAEDFGDSRRRKNPGAAGTANYVMPEPKQMIRLIKFNEMKSNIARLNAAELADYDQRLSDLCLENYALGDISQLNRGEINARINAASIALNESLDQAAGLALNDRLRDIDEDADEATMVAEAGEVSDTDLDRRPAGMMYVPSLADVEDAPPAPRPAAPKPVAPRPTAVPTPPPNAPRPVTPPTPPVAVPAPPPVQTAPPPRTSAPAPVQSAPPPKSSVPASPPKPSASPPARADAPAASTPRTCSRPKPKPATVCSPEERAKRSNRRTDPEVVEKMNAMLKRTLVDLQDAVGTDQAKTFRNCSHFHLIEADAGQQYKSQCIFSYGQAKRL